MQRTSPHRRFLTSLSSSCCCWGGRRRRLLTGNLQVAHLSGPSMWPGGTDPGKRLLLCAPVPPCFSWPPSPTPSSPAEQHPHISHGLAGGCEEGALSPPGAVPTEIWWILQALASPCVTPVKPGGQLAACSRMDGVGSRRDGGATRGTGQKTPGRGFPHTSNNAIQQASDF